MKKVTEQQAYIVNQIDVSELKFGDIFQFKQDGRLFMVTYKEQYFFTYSLVGDKLNSRFRYGSEKRMVYKLDNI